MIVKFGRYPQKSYSDQKQAIEWIILGKESGKSLLLSRYALDAVPYHEKLESTTWITCTLQRWLNDVFLRSAFTVEERQKILFTTLLSLDEAKEYFDCNSDRVCEPTEYALSKNRGIACDGESSCWWWLRSPGYHSYDAAFVDPSGLLGDYGLSVNISSVAVRPAIWVEPDVVDGSAETNHEFDPVSRPRHYADGNIECIDAMEDVFGVEAVKCFCLCNAFKYHWRHSLKNGAEDIEKATWYMDKYRELVNR